MRYVRCERSGVVPPGGCPHAPHAASPPPTCPPANPPTATALPQRMGMPMAVSVPVGWGGVVGGHGCWTPRGWGDGGYCQLTEPRISAVSGAVLGQGRNSNCRPGVPLGTLGLGPRAVGPGPHCVLRDAAHVGTHGDSGPPRRVPYASLLASGPIPPNFVLVTHSVQISMASPPALCPFGLDYAPPRRFLLLCPEPFGLGPIMPGAQFRTCGSWARLGAQGQGGWARRSQGDGLWP